MRCTAEWPLRRVRVQARRADRDTQCHEVGVVEPVVRTGVGHRQAHFVGGDHGGDQLGSGRMLVLPHRDQRHDDVTGVHAGLTGNVVRVIEFRESRCGPVDERGHLDRCRPAGSDDRSTGLGIALGGHLAQHPARFAAESGHQRAERVENASRGTVDDFGIHVTEGDLHRVVGQHVVHAIAHCAVSSWPVVTEGCPVWLSHVYPGGRTAPAGRLPDRCPCRVPIGDRSWCHPTPHPRAR